MKRMDMLAYTPVEFNFLGKLAKIFIISARQKPAQPKKFVKKCSSPLDCHCHGHNLRSH